MNISQKAIDLILDFEGLDQPGEWPGGASGVTIGHGYDLGYEDNFMSDWDGIIDPTDIARLKRVVGIKGSEAAGIARSLRDIHIPASAAAMVFAQVTLPRYTGKTLNVFPNSEALNPDALGALVSLVFNRGELVDSSDRRKEMLNIRTILQQSENPNSSGALELIADEFEAMCRLWPNVRGLRRRRVAEARLIRESM